METIKKVFDGIEVITFLTPEEDKHSGLEISGCVIYEDTKGHEYIERCCEHNKPEFHSIYLWQRGKGADCYCDIFDGKESAMRVFEAMLIEYPFLAGNTDIGHI